MAFDTEWVTGESDVTIYKGLEIQIEGIQLATDYKSLEQPQTNLECLTGA